MRALYFSPRDCWPTTTGARLRDFHQVRQLARAFRMTYLGFRRDEGPEVLRPGIEGLGEVEVILAPGPKRNSPWRLLRGLAGPEPIGVVNYTTPAMRGQLAGLLRERRFDTVQCEGVHLSGYLDTIREHVPPERTVCDWHNIESEVLDRYREGVASLPERLYAARTSRLLRAAEERLLAVCGAHLVCSARERDILQARAPRARIQVAGNGVDLAAYSDRAIEEAARRHGGPAPGGPFLVFVGSMDYHANIDGAVFFVREVWPKLRGAHPDLRLFLVGSRPAPAVEALRSEPGVAVTGTVEDVRPYYGRALAAVAPLRVAGGTRLKVLEAMAAGVPVISTRIGAEGLDVEDGRNILLADTPDCFAEAVRRLAAGGEARRRLAAEGRALVENRYGWDALGAGLREVHTSLMRKH